MTKNQAEWPTGFASAMVGLRTVIGNMDNLNLLDVDYAWLRYRAQYAIGVPRFLQDTRVSSTLINVNGVEVEATWPSHITLPFDLHSKDPITTSAMFRNRGKLRIILWLHGGGYCYTGANSFRHMFSYLAMCADALILAPDYRNAPENPFPCALDDVTKVYKTVEPCLIGGESAGGSLALALLLRLHQLGDKIPSKVIAFSPWVNLDEFTASSWTENANCDMLTLDACKACAKAYTSEPRNPLCSPHYADWTPLAGKVKILLDIGQRELFRDQILMFDKKLRRQGVEVYTHVAENLPHVYLAFHELLTSRRFFPQPARLLQYFGCFAQEDDVEPCTLECHQRAEWETAASQNFCENCFKEPTMGDKFEQAYAKMKKNLMEVLPQDSSPSIESRHNSAPCVSPLSPRTILRNCVNCRRRLCGECHCGHSCSQWIFLLRELCCLSKLEFGDFPNTSQNTITIDKTSKGMEWFRRMADTVDDLYEEVHNRIDKLLHCISVHIDNNDESLDFFIEGTSVRELVVIHLKLLQKFGLKRLRSSAKEQGVSCLTLSKFSILIKRVKHMVAVALANLNPEKRHIALKMNDFWNCTIPATESLPGDSLPVIDEDPLRALQSPGPPSYLSARSSVPSLDIAGGDAVRSHTESASSGKSSSRKENEGGNEGDKQNEEEDEEEESALGGFITRTLSGWGIPVPSLDAFTNAEASDQEDDDGGASKHKDKDETVGEEKEEEHNEDSSVSTTVEQGASERQGITEEDPVPSDPVPSPPPPPPKEEEDLVEEVHGEEGHGKEDEEEEKGLGDRVATIVRSLSDMLTTSSNNSSQKTLSEAAIEEENVTPREKAETQESLSPQSLDSTARIPAAHLPQETKHQPTKRPHADEDDSSVKIQVVRAAEWESSPLAADVIRRREADAGAISARLILDDEEEEDGALALRELEEGEQVECAPVELPHLNDVLDFISCNSPTRTSNQKTEFGDVVYLSPRQKEDSVVILKPPTTDTDANESKNAEEARED